MLCRLNIELVECEHTCTLGEYNNMKTTTTRRTTERKKRTLNIRAVYL